MSQGSGFVAHKDGKVVTNYHVIRGVGSAVVKFPDGAFYNAEGFLGIDPGRDIAILKISSPSREFPSLQLADASEVTVALASFAGDRQTFPNPVREVLPTASYECAFRSFRDAAARGSAATAFIKGRAKPSNSRARSR